jgi:ADP-ribose pyrophosphatase YjhB (NUDIX family)
VVATDPSFCPTCGTALDRRPVEGRDRPYCPGCERVVWRNPVPTAGVAVVDEQDDENRVLLVRRAQPPDAGEWGIPAGFLEHDERADRAAARELREETGLAVDPGALELLAVDRLDHPTGRRLVTVAYVVDRRRTSGEPTPGSDASEARFWTLDGLVSADEVLRGHDRDRVRRALDRF